jgi:hypothetical protein
MLVPPYVQRRRFVGQVVNLRPIVNRPAGSAYYAPSHTSKVCGLPQYGVGCQGYPLGPALREVLSPTHVRATLPFCRPAETLRKKNRRQDRRPYGCLTVLGNSSFDRDREGAVFRPAFPKTFKYPGATGSQETIPTRSSFARMIPARLTHDHH